MRTIIFAISLVAWGSATLAQTPNRTPEQIRKDSLGMIRFKKLYPEKFRLNRAPFKLKDSSDILLGWTSQLWLQDNVIVDSIHNNFHAEMPDTTTFTPYSAISVAGTHVKISYLRGPSFMGDGPATMTPYTRDAYIKDSVLFMSGKDTATGMMIPAFFRKDESYSVRITLNGKLIFDWKDVREFPESYYKASETDVLRGYNYPPVTYRSYGDVYLICDTTLNIHDQLLIEIKDGKKNWMLDRFNFTRVSAKPAVSAIRMTGEDGRSASILPSEKKTLTSAPVTRTSR